MPILQTHRSAAVDRVSVNDRFVSGQVVGKERWNQGLYTLAITADVEPFVAGQFTSLALTVDEELIARPYSIASAPQDSTLDFLFNVVPEGPLSPRLGALSIGDEVQVARRANGFFVLDEMPAGKTLWLLASGTGLGPYISLLRQGDVWRKFEQVIVLHAVRHSADLAYRRFLSELAASRADLQYHPVVTREPGAATLAERFPVIIGNGTLQTVCGHPFSPEHSRVMLCGSLAMIRDTTAALADHGLTKHRRSKPGQILTEKYW